MAMDSQESIIRLDYLEGCAEVWTERRGLVSRLQRLGFILTQRHGRGVWLTGGIKQVSFRKLGSNQGKPRTGASSEMLAKARAAKANREDDTKPV